MENGLTETRDSGIAGAHALKAIPDYAFRKTLKQQKFLMRCQVRIRVNAMSVRQHRIPVSLASRARNVTYVFDDSRANVLVRLSIESIVPRLRMIGPTQRSRERTQMNMNSARIRVAMGLILAIVGLTGAFAVKNGLAEIQRLTPVTEIAATAVATPGDQPASKPLLGAPESAQPQSPETAADPFAQDRQAPRAEITTVEAAPIRAEERIQPIPETEEFHSQIFRGTVREDVPLPVNESAPNARDPE